jgi:hypothetical protein
VLVRGWVLLIYIYYRTLLFGERVLFIDPMRLVSAAKN